MVGARVRDITRQLRAASDPVRAAALQRFFKTGRGEYGEGDRFLGLTVPRVRAIASGYRDMSLADVETLLESPWHEVRLAALVILTLQYPRADARRQAEIYRLYLRRTDRIDNWDLVDVSAPVIVGAHLLTRSRGVLRRLAASSNVWERRIAVIATQHLIRHGQFDDTLTLAERLMEDPHDLMHKAVGWMLREVGKRDEAVLLRFLDRHAAAMPRTALRYSIERLTDARRKRYMTLRRRDVA